MCSHEYCIVCIKTWRFRTCPLCREKYSIIETTSRDKRMKLRDKFVSFGSDEDSDYAGSTDDDSDDD